MAHVRCPQKRIWKENKKKKFTWLQMAILNEEQGELMNNRETLILYKIMLISALAWLAAGNRA